MRQAKHKWPVNCSRSCARRAQHAKNHGDKREVKRCLVCKEEFRVARWDSSKTYCSIKCSSIHRFGDPHSRKANTHERLERILRDEAYGKFIRNLAMGKALKYGIDHEDILQDYYLALAEGQNSKVEHTAMETVRNEYRRGMVGKRYINRGVIINDECLKFIKANKKSLNEIDFVDYIYDLKSLLNETEFQMVFLALKGFCQREIYEQMKGDVPRRLFHRLWNGTGLGKKEVENEFVEFDPDESRSKRKWYEPTYQSKAIYRAEDPTLYNA